MHHFCDKTLNFKGEIIIKKLFALMLFFVCTVTIFSTTCFANTVYSVRSSSIYYGKNWDFDLNRKINVVFSMKNVDNNLIRLDVRLNDSGFLCTSLTTKVYLLPAI
jgi:hypothetical protein